MLLIFLLACYVWRGGERRQEVCLVCEVWWLGWAEHGWLICHILNSMDAVRLALVKRLFCFMLLLAVMAEIGL